MNSTVPRLGGSACPWMRFSCLLLPHKFNSNVLLLVTAPVSLIFSSELVLPCQLVKTQANSQKEISYQWFCGIAFGGLCSGYIGDLGVPETTGMGLWRPFGASGVSWDAALPWKLGTRHDAQQALLSPVSLSTAAPREICVF